MRRLKVRSKTVNEWEMGVAVKLHGVEDGCVKEMKMLRFLLVVTKMDRIRNEYIRGTTQVGQKSKAKMDWTYVVEG